jgi:hypothetical protein
MYFASSCKNSCKCPIFFVNGLACLPFKKKLSQNIQKPFE